MDPRKLILIFFPLLIIASLILAISLSKSQSQISQVPAGCYYQQVQCIQAPCDPVLICPEQTISPTPPTPLVNPTPVTGITIYKKSPYESKNFGVNFNFPSTKYIIAEAETWDLNRQISVAINVRDKVMHECMSASQDGTDTCPITDNNLDLVNIALFRNTANKSLEELVKDTNPSDRSTVEATDISNKSGILLREPVGIRNGHWLFIIADKHSNRIASFMSEFNPTTNLALKQLITSFIFSGPPGTTSQPTVCKVAGCSSQLCVKAGEDVVTTCEYRDIYACYKSATCKVQPSGECGWTETPELLSCLQNPPLNHQL